MKKQEVIMITISRNNITEWLLLDTYSERHIAKDKLQFFEKKHGTTFSKFENKMKKGKENFEHYDDYIEWKAFNRIMNSVEKKINDIRNGNIKVS